VLISPVEAHRVCPTTSRQPGLAAAILRNTVSPAMSMRSTTRSAVLWAFRFVTPSYWGLLKQPDKHVFSSRFHPFQVSEVVECCGSLSDNLSPTSARAVRQTLRRFTRSIRLLTGIVSRTVGRRGAGRKMKVLRSRLVGGSFGWARPRQNSPHRGPDCTKPYGNGVLSDGVLSCSRALIRLHSLREV
jgi:hypothetical protein